MSPRLIIEIVAGLVLFGGVLWYNHHEREIGAQQCLADQHEQAEKDRAQGEQAIADATAKNIAIQKQDEARRAADAETEKEKMRQELNMAHAKASDLQRRYEAQLVADKSCAAWSQEKVACALQ